MALKPRTEQLIYYIICSTCSGYMFTVTIWLWLPSVRSNLVQQT